MLVLQIPSQHHIENKWFRVNVQQNYAIGILQEVSEEQKMLIGCNENCMMESSEERLETKNLIATRTTGKSFQLPSQ